jgi:pilus assembly protein CpaE
VSLDGFTFLVVTDESSSEALIRSALPANAPVRVASLHDALGSGAQLVTESAADMVLVGCSEHPEQALRVIAEMAAVNSSRPIIALYEGNPNGFMGPAFRAGADDLIVLPQPAGQLAFELQRVVARRRTPGGDQRRAPLVTVLGPKGGTGKTVTACNLAVALADGGARPVIVDTDLQFGDVGLALGLKPEKTIYDLVVAGGSLDGEKINSFLMQHRSGAAALLAPTRPDQAAVVTTTFLRDIFEVLRLSHDYVIIDTPPAFSPEVIAAIDASSHLCVVGMLDALSLKDTKIGLETLAQMGYPSDQITLVLNRADTSVGISMNDVYALLRKGPDVLVPSDRSIPRALTTGMTIYEADPKSGAARAFGTLARRYSDLAGIASPLEHADSASTSSGESDPSSGRRLRLMRRGN